MALMRHNTFLDHLRCLSFQQSCQAGMLLHRIGEGRYLSVQSGLGGCKASFVFGFETMEVLVRLEVFPIVLANILTLMINLLLFRIPEWMIKVCVAILNADFISDPGLIHLDFHNLPPRYNYARAQIAS